MYEDCFESGSGRSNSTLTAATYLPLQANIDKAQLNNRFCVGNMIVNAGLLVGGAAGARNIDEFIDYSFFRDYILAELDRRGKYLLFLG